MAHYSLRLSERRGLGEGFPRKPYEARAKRPRWAIRRLERSTHTLDDYCSLNSLNKSQFNAGLLATNKTLDVNPANINHVIKFIYNRLCWCQFGISGLGIQIYINAMLCNKPVFRCFTDPSTFVPTVNAPRP